MKSKSLFAVVLLASMFPLAAYAGPTASSTSNVSAQTSAQAQGNELNASLGPMQNSLTVNGGEAAKIPLGTPVPILPGVPSAPIFGDTSQRPTNERGVQTVLQYLQDCQPIATREHKLNDVYVKGESGKTQVVWSPNQAYYRNDVGNAGVAKSKTDGMPWANGTRESSDESDNAKTASVIFPEAPARYQCLGLITVWATPGSQIAFTTVVADARSYVLDNPMPSGNVYLLSVSEAIAAADAMNASGGGIGVSPGGAISPTNLLSILSLGIGYNKGSGNTSVSSALGDTFYVLSPSTTGVVIDPARISRRYYKRR